MEVEDEEFNLLVFKEIVKTPLKETSIVQHQIAISEKKNNPG